MFKANKQGIRFHFNLKSREYMLMNYRLYFTVRGKVY